MSFRSKNYEGLTDTSTELNANSSSETLSIRRSNEKFGHDRMKDFDKPLPSLPQSRSLWSDSIESEPNRFYREPSDVTKSKERGKWSRWRSEKQPSQVAFTDTKPAIEVVSRQSTLVLDRPLTHTWLKASADILMDLCTDWWLGEILCWMFGALCMCGIAFVLGLWDGHPIPEKWPLGITLNAYISVLSAVAKYALAVPLDEAIGELKWLWFASSPPSGRRLMDFERFDSASRGPWGALALLTRTRTRSIASIGASIALLSLALDPFFQQIVSFPERPTTVGRSAVPRSVHFSFQDAIVEINNNPNLTIIPNLGLSDTIDRFMVGNDPTSVQEIAPFCPSDDCSWPIFNTLAICSDCVDISQTVQFGCFQEDGYWRPDWTYSKYGHSNQTIKSCGYFFNATSDRPMLMSGYTLNSSSGSTPGEALVMRQMNFRDPRNEQHYWDGSLNFKNVPSPIVNWIIAAVQNAEEAYNHTAPTVTECILRWCTKSISARYHKGNYSEQTISVFTNDTAVPYPIRLLSDANYEYDLNITIIPPEQDEVFTVPNVTALQTIFSFDLDIPLYQTQAGLSANPYIRYRNDDNETDPRVRTYTANHWSPPNNISEYVAEMALTLTNTIRSYPNSSEHVFGSGSFERYVHIQWVWFSLPLIVLIMTLVFLFATMAQSSKSTKVGVWKTSALATLLHGLSSGAKEDFGRFNKMRDIKARARNVKIILNQDTKGCTLVNGKGNGEDGG